MLLPVLIPVFISIAVFRLSMAARDSRARIKLLETDESKGPRLIHILSTLEQKVETAVANLIDDPLSESDPTPGSTTTPPVEIRSVEDDKRRPPLNPLQLRMAAWLNKLPGLKKERAFIPLVVNSHAVIVCRDPKRFPTHRVGEGVIRYWADQFVL